MKNLLLGVAVAMWVTASGNAFAESKTTEIVLDNGLDVIIREDHRAPVVAVETVYRVGAVDEKDGKTGLAHMLEHMMFKGTDKVPGEQFSSIVEHFGGEENAFTTDDFTAYYQVEAADRLPLALELESDRMEGLQLKTEDFVQEHRVVMEERRWRIDDQPSALAQERFNAIANVASPYRRPTIGWMSDIAGLNIHDVRNWYHEWYEPGNAVLVIVGDVNTVKTLALIHHFYDRIPAHPVPDHVIPREMDSPGDRFIRIHNKVRVPFVWEAYNVPGFRTAADVKDVFALTVLAGILDQGDSSRLQQDMVHMSQVAASADAGYSGISRGDTLFELTAVPSPGHTLIQLEQSFDQEIARLKNTQPTPEEMQRVLAQLKASEVFSRDSIAGEAGALVSFEGIGLGWKDRDAYLHHLEQVTPAQVQEVARKYFVNSRRTIAEVEPAQ